MKNPQTIDYTSFHSGKSKIDRIALSDHGITWVVLLVGLLLVGIGLLIAPILYIYLDGKRIRLRRNMWRQFVKDNGWNEVGRYPDIVPPSMHRLKFKDSINNVIEAQVEGVQCSLFNLTYGTPGFSFILGWYRSVDARSFTILHAQLPIELPQLAIVSQKTAFGVPKGIGGILRYDSSCSIPLPHGDAINYELYVPAGLTRYAEQMISLDLCNILNAANVTLELEIVGRDLFILANHALYDRQEVMELLQSLAPLVKRVANTKFELSAHEAEARLQYS